MLILLNGWICLHGVSALSRFTNALKISALSFHFTSFREAVAM